MPTTETYYGLYHPYRLRPYRGENDDNYYQECVVMEFTANESDTHAHNRLQQWLGKGSHVCIGMCIAGCSATGGGYRYCITQTEAEQIRRFQAYERSAIRQLGQGCARRRAELGEARAALSLQPLPSRENIAD